MSSRPLGAGLILATLALALSACQSTPAPVSAAPSPVVSKQPVGVPPAPFVPADRTPTPFATLELPGTDEPFQPMTLTPQPDSALTITRKSSSTVDVGGFRYIVTTFNVKNVGSTPLNNMTWVAYVKNGNVAESALRNIRGSSDPADLYRVYPAHGLTASGSVDANLADLALLTSTEAQAVTTAARGGATPIIGASDYALEYGFVARRCTANCTSATPTWTRSIAPGETGQITTAFRVPIDPLTNDFKTKFAVTYIVANESDAVVAQSLEEQAAGTIAGLPAASTSGFAQVRTLCRPASAPAFTGNNANFLLSARIAGPASGALARMGASFARNATAAPSALSTYGNTRTSSSSDLTALYDVLPGTTLTFGGATSAQGGDLVVTNSANGAFTFDPKAGYIGADTLRYTVSDGPNCVAPQSLTNTAQVNNPLIWYVNSASTASEDGRSTTPFKTLSAAVAASGPGSALFVYAGSGAYTGNVTLKANQTLLGEGVGLGVTAGAAVPAASATATLVPAGATPSLNSASGATLTLPSGATNVMTVRGVKLASASGGFALSGTNFGTLNVSNVEVDSGTAGRAVSLDTGAVAGSFSSVKGTSVLLKSLTGTLNLGSGAIVNAASTENAFEVNGGSADLTFGGTISASNVGTGRAVSVSGRSGGSLALGGDVGSGATASARGVSIAGAGSVSFSGNLYLDTGNQTAFAVSGGTLTATGASSTLKSSGVPALSVQNATVGNSGLTFRSVNTTGGTNGILVSNIGTNGVVNVTGTAGTAGSGGTISGATAEGVRVIGPARVKLERVKVVGSSQNGVYVTNARLDLNASTIENSGQSTVAQIENRAGVWLEGNGSSTVTGVLTNNTFTGNPRASLYVSTPFVLGSPSTAQANVQATGNIIQNTPDRGMYFLLSSNGSGNFDISNNTINLNGPIGTQDEGIRFKVCSDPGSCGTAPTMNARISGNTVTMSSSASTGTGIAYTHEQKGTSNVRIENNTVTNFGVLGFDILSGTGANSTSNLQVTLTNNTATPRAGYTGATDGSRISAGNNTTASTLCLNATSNKFTGYAEGTPSGYNGFALRVRTAATFQLQNYPGGAVGTFVQNNNSPSTARASGTFSAASCATPSIPATF